ncbi:MAG: hypothetical protein ACOCX1_05310 [Fimbriimonadaceae bacterium]
MWGNSGVDGSSPGSSTYMTNITAFEGTKWAALGAGSSTGFFGETI